MTITGRQIREARELVGWTRADLARSASVALPVIEVVEDHGSTFMLLDGQMQAICRAFEDSGVVFIRGDAETRVRLRKAEP